MSETLSAHIREGLQRAKEHWRIGGRPKRVSDTAVKKVITLPAADAAKILGLSERHYCRRRDRLETPKQRAARMKKEAPPRRVKVDTVLGIPAGMTNAEAAKHLGIAISTLVRRRRLIELAIKEKPSAGQ